jgi:uncharacterized membrane protein YfcA
MAFWAWSIPPELAGPMVVFGSLLGQTLSIGKMRLTLDFRRSLPLIIGGLIGVPIGVALLPLIDHTVFKACVGALLVVWCPAMLLARELPRISGGGRLADGVAGWLGGVMGGLGGLTGPAPILWCTLRGWDKDVQRSVFQSFNICMHMLTITMYATSGLISVGSLKVFAVMAPAMIIPTLLGVRVYARVSHAAFRRVVLVLLLLSGMVLLGTSVPDLLRPH